MGLGPGGRENESRERVRGENELCFLPGSNNFFLGIGWERERERERGGDGDGVDGGGPWEEGRYGTESRTMKRNDRRGKGIYGSAQTIRGEGYPASSFFLFFFFFSFGGMGDNMAFLHFRFLLSFL